MTDKQKQSLLKVARQVVEQAVRGEAISGFDSEDPFFSEKRGCFVTLHNQGELRGCIGRFADSERTGLRSSGPNRRDGPAVPG